MSVPNIEKLFQYLQCVATHPIKYNGQVIGDIITEFKLNSTLFFTDCCQNCGGCDPSESNLYTQSEYENIINCDDQIFINSNLDPKYLHKLQHGLDKKEVEINGKRLYVYEYIQEPNELYLPIRGKILKRCTWCFQESSNVFKCRIHPVESITCIMPHLRMYHMKKSCRSSIGIHQFGRNWALKCPINLKSPENENEFESNKKNVVHKLNRLNQIGLDLNIETYLPVIIDVIEKQEFKNYQELKFKISSNSKRIIKQKKLF